LPQTPTDVLGTEGIYVDPLWRITVELTPLERDLLRSWWVRRLGFIAHAGASVISTNQSYSRLEHSLGLLSLVAHFTPDDRVARAAALVHDIGHLPFSHTFEGVDGLNHHALGAARIGELSAVFRRHRVEAADVLAVVEGRRPSALHGPLGLLKLDHLDSFVRSGRSHGRTRQSPPATLSRLRLRDGAVDTDAGTAEYLLDLIAAEARLHLSVVNVVATGIMRQLASTVVKGMTTQQREAFVASTDDQLWAILLTDPRTAALADELRRDPAAWDAEVQRPGATPSQDAVQFQIDRLYLDVPLVDGQPFERIHDGLNELPTPPVRYIIRPAKAEIISPIPAA
jgi:HD superfamily phosphohydrolase